MTHKILACEPDCPHPDCVRARTVGIYRLRPEVVAFACAMEQKLREREVRNPSGWKDVAPRELANRILDEYLELWAEINTDGDIKGEAVDIGNFAMMVFDNA